MKTRAISTGFAAAALLTLSGCATHNNQAGTIHEAVVEVIVSSQAVNVSPAITAEVNDSNVVVNIGTPPPVRKRTERSTTTYATPGSSVPAAVTHEVITEEPVVKVFPLFFKVVYAILAAAALIAGLAYFKRRRV